MSFQKILKINEPNLNNLQIPNWKNTKQIAEFLSVVSELEKSKLIQPTDLISLKNICFVLDEIYSKQKEINLFQNHISKNLIANEIALKQKELTLIEFKKSNCPSEQTIKWKELDLEERKILNDIYKLQQQLKIKYFSIDNKNQLQENKSVSVSGVAKDLQFLLTSNSLTPSTRIKLQTIQSMVGSNSSLANEMAKLLNTNNNTTQNEVLNEFAISKK